MLLRRDERGVVAIGQPSHAWISGQLARAWGNERFGAVEPREEVCLAAEQHDVGWGRRDLAATLNPDTGLPRSFMEMPLDVHLTLWTTGPRRMLSQSRYAALLVSMHGSRLYRRRNLDEASPEDADAIRSFLMEQARFQEELLALLRVDPLTASAARHELVKRNSQLIWTWDYLSLAACLEWAPTTAHAVPTAQEPVELELAGSGGPGELSLNPWPLWSEALTVRCEGRRLEGPYGSEEALDEALAAAPWETIELRLVPGGS
jgi:hypothetical protein